MGKDKDPAFLFYSNDFYEGTRTMFPEERACYIDLMIYQHQNGCIPGDINRIKLYCTGCSEESIKRVLSLKFKLTKKGWHNEVLSNIIKARADFSRRQAINGTVGQFWKKARRFLDDAQYNSLKHALKNVDNELLFKEIDGKAMDEAMLKAMLKHLEIVNVIEVGDVIEIENKGIEKEGLGERERGGENYTDEFEVFFDSYHKITGLSKSDKKPAFNHWKKLTKAEKTKALDNIQPFYDSLKNKEYCKKCRTYLSDKNFNDEFKVQHMDDPSKPRFMS